jgi:hypothetical protein
MLVLAMLFFTFSVVAPAFGPIAAGYASNALTVAEVLFVAEMAIYIIGSAMSLKPAEERVLEHHHA